MRLWLTALMALLAAPVWAQASVAQVESLTARELDKVLAILVQQQRNFREVCGNVKIIKATAISVAEPVILSDGKPMQGKWRARYSVDACGTVALRNVAMSVVPGGIAIEPLVPGETLTDTTLQADVLKSFEMAGRVAMPQCASEVVVRETKVRIYPQRATDRWQELWVGSMCGRDLGQAVEFLPTKGGTTFKMSLPVQSRQIEK